MITSSRQYIWRATNSRTLLFFLKALVGFSTGLVIVGSVTLCASSELVGYCTGYRCTKKVVHGAQVHWGTSRGLSGPTRATSIGHQYRALVHRVSEYVCPTHDTVYTETNDRKLQLIQSSSMSSLPSRYLIINPLCLRN
jgi:hypothetical protein